jgi:hypothetical protein
MVVAVTIIGDLYSCSKSSDMLPSTAKAGTSAKGQLHFKKDPTGQFVDKSVQITGYEDGRERPIRFKADPRPGKSTIGEQYLIPADPEEGGGGGPAPISYVTVGPYKFISSEGQGMDGGSNNPGQYILDLEIIKGSSASAGPESGYTKLDTDLNSGAGGKYIYLFFFRNTVNNHRGCDDGWSHSTPISDVKVIAWQTLSVSKTPDNFCPIYTPDGAVYPWNYKSSDLNDGAGGRYIYSYQSKASTPTPIKEIGIVAGNNSSIQPPAGWVRTGDDLNAGAGGDYIYYCYKR